MKLMFELPADGPTSIGPSIPRVPRSTSCSQRRATWKRPGTSSRRLWPRLVILDRASSLWMEILPIQPSFRKLKRPVRWVETRTESMLTLGHGRSQIQEIELGGTADGRVLAASRPYYYQTDPLVDFTAPADGDYLVRLHDMTFLGGLPYRLIISNHPQIENAFPAAIDACPIGFAACRRAGMFALWSVSTDCTTESRSP